jgi:myo-inositol-1(or 4)-monophosphatase
MVHQPEKAARRALLVRAAEAGAAVIRDGAARRHTLDWREKGPTDFVSEVDLGAEARILDVLHPALPGLTILAEETASTTPPEVANRGLTAVIDPLDGTTNFLHGVPEYAVSIALLQDGDPLASVVLAVPRAECFTAVRGAGAWLGDAPIRVSAISDPRRALIGTGFPFKDPADIAPYQAQMSRVMAGVAGVRRPGAASLDLASVACGRFDAFWENQLGAWDFAAGMLLVTEAGGLATTCEGAPLRPIGPSGVLAGNPAMHRWVGERIH